MLTPRECLSWEKRKNTVQFLGNIWGGYFYCENYPAAIPRGQGETTLHPEYEYRELCAGSSLVVALCALFPSDKFLGNLVDIIFWWLHHEGVSPRCWALCPEQGSAHSSTVHEWEHQTAGVNYELLFGWVRKAAFSPLLVNQLLWNSWAEQGIPAYTNSVSSPAKTTFQYLCGEHEPHKSPQVPRLGTTGVQWGGQTCSLPAQSWAAGGTVLTGSGTSTRALLSSYGQLKLWLSLSSRTKTFLSGSMNLSTWSWCWFFHSSMHLALVSPSTSEFLHWNLACFVSCYEEILNGVLELERKMPKMWKSITSSGWVQTNIISKETKQ